MANADGAPDNLSIEANRAIDCGCACVFNGLTMFDSMSHQLRQDKLLSILEGRLTADEFSSVGAIAALTPAEATAKAG